jgi:hypothetical protein
MRRLKLEDLLNSEVLDQFEQRERERDRDRLMREKEEYGSKENANIISILQMRKPYTERWNNLPKSM